MLLLLLIIAVIGVAYAANKYSWRQCLATRIEGIRVNRLVKQLLVDLQQHRGMVNVFLSGDKSFKTRIEQKQAAIVQDIAALDAAHGRGLMTAKRWESICNDWRALSREALALPAEVSFKRHSELIRAVLYSMGDVAERSQIAGVCAIDTALVDALWSKLPGVAESLGQARGIGSSVAAKNYCSSVARVKLRFLEERVSETMVSVNNELAHADLSQAASFTQAWKETHAAVQIFLKLLDEKLLSGERPTIDAEHYFGAGTKAMDAVFNAFDQASSALENACAGMAGGVRAS
jgi:methyl-accepting chemotaxis protein